MAEKAMMAKFDPGHRIPLVGGYWLQKSDENVWQIGGPFGSTTDAFLAMNISGNVPVGDGGSMDGDIERFAEGIRSALKSE